LERRKIFKDQDKMTITKQSTTNWLNFYNSSLGKKIITGITGLGLILFVFLHMSGNLLLISDREAYNQLGNWIESLSFLLYGVELTLLIVAVFHIVVGITIRLNTKRSRPVEYNQIKSIGEPSKQSLSSRSMAITGVIVLGFLIWHLLSFKFGNYYSTTINGVPMRDLSRLVVEKFHSPVYTFGYLGAIALLGLHLRHGFWSVWQSLGVLNGQNSSWIYQISLLFAVITTLGFILVPLVIYFNG
jgi:succinate dehydrogenase / fumarate reductase, cytochrome b subunit